MLVARRKGCVFLSSFFKEHFRTLFFTKITNKSSSTNGLLWKENSNMQKANQTLNLSMITCDQQSGWPLCRPTDIRRVLPTFIFENCMFVSKDWEEHLGDGIHPKLRLYLEWFLDWAPPAVEGLCQVYLNEAPGPTSSRSSDRAMLSIIKNTDPKKNSFKNIF